MDRFYVYMGNNVGLTTLKEGSYIYIDTRDISLAPHLIRYGEWEREDTNVFKKQLKLIPANGTVLDIGANFGYYSLLALHYRPDLKMYAIDGNERMSELLIWSGQINGFPNLKVDNLAISDHNGIESFGIHPVMMGSSGLKDKGNIVEVETMTLDDYCGLNFIEKIDFMKIDAEGAEEMILKNSNIKIDRLIIEFSHSRYEHPKDFFYHLKSKFNSIKIIGSQLKEIDEYEDLFKIPKQFNMLLCTNE